MTVFRALRRQLAGRMEDLGSLGDLVLECQVHYFQMHARMCPSILEGTVSQTS